MQRLQRALVSATRGRAVVKMLESQRIEQQPMASIAGEVGASERAIIIIMENPSLSAAPCIQPHVCRDVAPFFYRILL